MSQARGTLHPLAVHQIQAHDPAPPARREPREQEQVRVQQRLAALPPERRRRVHVEEPEEADVQRLQVYISINN
jgi:hypothetical protein